MASDCRWWQRGVIYQIYPRSFYDTTGNGVGDLQGVIDKLDHLNDGTLHSLGIDAIWLSPFFPSPMADFGYDVADYCNVDPLFGDLDTFARLVVEAHRRGIKVIIDYVPNHSSDQHPWFQESRQSRDNPKRDWYIWRDPRPDGSPPNNWGSFFGGPAWTWDEATSQYYLHQFVPQQPELNWRNPAVRAAMLDALRFWLDRGVDGFRMDVIWLILKDPQLWDNPPNPDADPNLPPEDIFGRLLQVHNGDQDEVHEILREMRHLLDGYQERFAIGEIYLDWDRWVRYYGQNGDELHLAYNFHLLQQPWQVRAVQKSVGQLESVLPKFAWPNYVLANHDQPRVASRFGAAQARPAAMLLLTLRGTPTIYYGDELGLPNGVIPADKIQDPQGVNLGAERSRDAYRTPMQWNAGPYAGFSSAEPWLPVSADYRTCNVEVQAADSTSMLNLYRRLLWYRRSSQALQVGGYEPLDAGEGCMAYLRAASGERRLVLLNFTDEVRRPGLKQLGCGRVALSTYLDRDGEQSLDAIELRPHEGLIVEL